MKLSCLGLLALLVVVLAAALQSEGAISCTSVYQTLAPCLGYLNTPPQPLDPACCPAVRSVAGSANSKPDRQTLCSCTKSLAATYPSSIPRANQLLKTCGVTISFPLSSTVDCTRVN